MVGGQRLGDYQLVPAMLADSVTELFAARAMLYEVARAIDAGEDRKVLHAPRLDGQAVCSEMAGRVADRAVQVFGGRGYMRENVAERMYRELRVERIWEGASELQRLIVGQQLLKRGPAAVLGDDSAAPDQTVEDLPHLVPDASVARRRPSQILVEQPRCKRRAAPLSFGRCIRRRGCARFGNAARLGVVSTCMRSWRRCVAAIRATREQRSLRWRCT